MNYKLANKIENVIESCCIGGDELNDPEQLDAASLIAYKLYWVLDGIDITDRDWTLICTYIQSGLANAAAKAIRILGASHNIDVITDVWEEK